jgi:NAD(P)-dependent dehydrogenase (short-subunit alcohol dehydrogenase family)
MPKAIPEQVIVITGASSGIGLATALTAARRGAKVVLAARNARDLEREAERIRRDGGEAVALPTDVSDAQQVERLVRRALEEYGRIDSWIGVAAVSAYATFEEQPLDDFRRILEVNFLGQVYGAKYALPHLEASAGALIILGSTLSDRGVPLQGAYCASKHALKGWLDSLRVELQKKGSRTRVTLIKPSSINTPLFNKAKTQMGVMPQPIPPVYEPELAVDAILRAAEGTWRELFVGGAGKALSLGERISPKLVDLQQRLQGFDSQKTEWPKSEDAPNNLFAPVEDDGGVRGDFSRGAKHASLYQSIAAHPVLSALAAAALLEAGAARLARASPGTAAGSLLHAGALTMASRGILAALYEK